MLELDDISFSYGNKRILNNISLTLDNGVTTLIGPNGAGKTTLIKLIVGLMKPDNGSISLNDTNIGSLGDKYYDHIGYMPQMPVFYSNYTARNFLLYMAELKGMNGKKAKFRADELLAMTNLSEYASYKIKEFSGGMKQRLGIAQAMLNNPEILVLDEPTAGLDPIERIRLKNIVTEIASERIVIYATHIVSDVECIAKKILLLNQQEYIFNTLENVLKPLENFVWLVSADSYEKMMELSSRYKVSKLRECNEGGYELRIISPYNPSPTCLKVDATLEDVFLFYFSERAENNDGF